MASHSEDIQHWQELLRKYRRNAQKLREQLAGFGKGEERLDKLNQLDAEKDAIQQAKAALRGLAVPIPIERNNCWPKSGRRCVSQRESRNTRKKTKDAKAFRALRALSPLRVSSCPFAPSCFSLGLAAGASRTRRHRTTETWRKMRSLIQGLQFEAKKEETVEIIVLGGAGDMGSRAVEDLATSEGVRRVTIADRNVTTARQVAARLAGQGAEVDVKRIDAHNHHELVEALRGYDVAASALGPFYLFETKLVRAAIEAGVDYASICDEWEAAGAVIDQFHQEARKKGVTILTGLGTSPGVSNVGVRYHSQQLDKTRRVDVSVYQPLNAGGGEAVIRHMLHIISGQVVAWRQGKRVLVPACSEERVVEFPRFGPIKVWNMGHSEPETIPRFIPGVEEVNFFMGFGPGAGLFIRPARLGLFANRRIRDAMARIVCFIERMTSEEPDVGAVRVDVWGQVAGEEVHRMACGIGQMREATGLSLSIGTLMLARGELLTEEGGVYAPEACLDPQKFIAYFSAKGIQAYEDLAMTQPIA